MHMQLTKDNESVFFFLVQRIATNFEMIPPTINPKDQANKLAIPDINVTNA